MNSEIVGLPTRSDWGVVFERVDSLPRHPVQLYESLAYLSIFVLLVLVYRFRGHKLANGKLTGLFLVTIFTVRFLLEYVKTPQAEFAVSWGVITSYSIHYTKLYDPPGCLLGRVLLG